MLIFGSRSREGVNMAGSGVAGAPASARSKCCAAAGSATGEVTLRPPTERICGRLRSVHPPILAVLDRVRPRLHRVWTGGVVSGRLDRAGSWRSAVRCTKPTSLLPAAEDGVRNRPTS